MPVATAMHAPTHKIHYMWYMQANIMWGKECSQILLETWTKCGISNSLNGDMDCGTPLVYV